MKRHPIVLFFGTGVTRPTTSAPRICFERGRQRAKVIALRLLI
jgi:hypothetical protein